MSPFSLGAVTGCCGTGPGALRDVTEEGAALGGVRRASPPPWPHVAPPVEGLDGRPDGTQRCLCHFCPGTPGSVTLRRQRGVIWLLAAPAQAPGPVCAG